MASLDIRPQRWSWEERRLLVCAILPLRGQLLTMSSAEMDVWEANSMSTALTPHSCQPEGYAVCEDSNCGGTYSLDRYAGTCDANGCDCKQYPPHN